MNENVIVQWNELPDEAKYVAMQHGAWFWFTKKPRFDPLIKGWVVDDDGRWGVLDWKSYICYNSLVTSENSLTARHCDTDIPSNPKPSPHKHAELIKLWADNPSLRFEVRYLPNEEWVPTVKVIPAWDENAEYRVKEKVIHINGVKVPAPESSAPAMDTQYFVPNLKGTLIKGRGTADVIAVIWNGTDSDYGRLECGMIHLNAKAAAIHKHAIVAANKSY